MIFKEKSIDKEELFEAAKVSFYKLIQNLHADDIEEFAVIFGNHNISDLNLALARISYSKNFEIEDLFYFDQDHTFTFYVTLYVFIIDEDCDRENLCAYNLVLNEKLIPIDDFLS